MRIFFFDVDVQLIRLLRNQKKNCFQYIIYRTRIRPLYLQDSCLPYKTDLKTHIPSYTQKFLINRIRLKDLCRWRVLQWWQIKTNIPGGSQHYREGSRRPLSYFTQINVCPSLPLGSLSEPSRVWEIGRYCLLLTLTGIVLISTNRFNAIPVIYLLGYTEYI